MLFKRKTVLSIISIGVLFLCLTFPGNSPINKSITCVKAAEAEHEIEPDDYESNASILNLNVPCIGSLKDEHDVDFYKFNITEDGTVSINFKHKLLNGSEKTWDISISNSTGTLISYFSSALDTETAGSDKLFLPYGEYIIKVVKDTQNFNDAEYEININFTLYNKYLENEPDNTINDAFPIELNKTYTGKLETDTDVDYYTLSLGKGGNLAINFKHEIANNIGAFNIEVLDKSNNKCGEFASNGDIKETKFNINLLPGEYYLLIKKGTEFSNMDYNIYTSFEASNAVFEAESNNNVNSANSIRLNTVYSGKLNYNEDVDYYKCIISKYSNVAFYFEHKEFKNTNNSIDISLLNSTSNVCFSFKVNGDEVITKCNFTIPAGTYFICIKGINSAYIDDYKFKIAATAAKKK